MCISLCYYSYYYGNYLPRLSQGRLNDPTADDNSRTNSCVFYSAPLSFLTDNIVVDFLVLSWQQKKISNGYLLGVLARYRIHGRYRF